MNISVITPVWNRVDLTSRFLYQHQTTAPDNLDIEWIIIDNGSTDETKSVLQSWQGAMGEKLRVIALSENTGFGPGNNRGAEVATGDILVFLSNDVQILGNYLTPIFQTVTSSNILYGAEIFSHNTGWNTFEEIGTIPYVAGWCVIASRQLWGKVGPWDERFVPCDYEDMDLSYHVKRSGGSLSLLDLPLKHDSGKSAERLPEGRLKVTLQNQKRFCEKWGVTLV